MKLERTWPETRLRRRQIQEKEVSIDSPNRHVFSWELLSLADWKYWLNRTMSLCRHHTTTPPQTSTPNSPMDITQLYLNIRARQQQFDLLWESCLCIYTTTFPKASMRIALIVMLFGSLQLSDRFQDLKVFLVHQCTERVLRALL